MGVYPFMFGAAKDFKGIIEEMDHRGIQEPYDWDKYAEVFFPKAEELEMTGEQAEKEGQLEKAAEYYFRSSAIYRIARFPAPRSPKQKEAWEKCKLVVKKAFKLKAEANNYPPIHEVLVPHAHALEHEGKEIPIFHQLPAGASKENPVPAVLIITGLDGYRTELAVWAEGFRRNNVAFMVVEIPGTGDCPADAKDPLSPDRLFTSLIEWIRTQEGIDSKRVAVWAFSTGGFYGIRLAHTNPDDFAGVVAVGSGCHYFLEREWLDNVNHLEYPFDLADTLAYKFGYGNDVETFKKEASDRFSLLKDGTLDKPRCARLLLVNVGIS
jgi:pimeloyl-ACP methyl ester carboxylesterase